MFLDIAHRNGVEIDFEPVYGGISYLEKQDFIIENQKRRIAENQATLDAIAMKISDLEAFVEEVAEDAYEKACEVVSETVAEKTREEDIEELRKYKKWLTSDERKTSKDKRDFVGRCLDNLENKLRSMALKVADKVMGALQNPRLKEQKKAEVSLTTKVRIFNRLPRSRWNSYHYRQSGCSDNCPAGCWLVVYPVVNLVVGSIFLKPLYLLCF